MRRRSILAAGAAYASVVGPQAWLLRGIATGRDLTAGDTSQDFRNAARWYEGFLSASAHLRGSVRMGADRG